jgi:hypothetical protein
MLLTWPAAYLLNKLADILHILDIGIYTILFITYGLLLIWYLMPIALAIWVPSRVTYLRRPMLILIVACAYISILYIPAQRGVDFVSILGSAFAFLQRLF